MSYLDDLLNGYRVIYDDGTALPKRNKVNLIGFTVADNPTTESTDVTGGGGGGGGSSLWADAVANATALRAIGAGSRVDKQVRLVEGLKQSYRYDDDTGANVTDDGVTLIRPGDKLSTDNGAWYPATFDSQTNTALALARRDTTGALRTNADSIGQVTVTPGLMLDNATTAGGAGTWQNSPAAVFKSSNHLGGSTVTRQIAILNNGGLSFQVKDDAGSYAERANLFFDTAESRWAFVADSVISSFVDGNGGDLAIGTSSHSGNVTIGKTGNITELLSDALILGTDPADDGLLRLPYGGDVLFRNTGDSANIRAFAVGTGLATNRVLIAESGITTEIQDDVVALGDLSVAGSFLTAVIDTGSATDMILKRNASEIFRVTSTGVKITGASLAFDEGQTPLVQLVQRVGDNASKLTSIRGQAPSATASTASKKVAGGLTLAVEDSLSGATGGATLLLEIGGAGGGTEGKVSMSLGDGQVALDFTNSGTNALINSSGGCRFTSTASGTAIGFNHSATNGSVFVAARELQMLNESFTGNTRFLVHAESGNDYMRLGLPLVQFLNDQTTPTITQLSTSGNGTDMKVIAQSGTGLSSIAGDLYLAGGVGNDTNRGNVFFGVSVTASSGCRVIGLDTATVEPTVAPSGGGLAWIDSDGHLHKMGTDGVDVTIG